MTDVTNTLKPFTTYVASTFHTTQALGTDTPVDGWHVPNDICRQSVGREVTRMFGTSRMGVDWYGSILLSAWVTKIAGTLANDHIIVDMSSKANGGVSAAQVAAGGYGLQFGGGATPSLEFMFRNAGAGGSGPVLLAVPLADLHDYIWYQPNNEFNQTPGKQNEDYHVGAVLNFLPEGRYVDLYVDGNVILSDEIPPGWNADPDPDAGIMIYANAIAAADAVPLTKVMNTGAGADAGFRVSSFFAQKIETDKSDTAVQVMADACLIRQAQPARGVGL